MTNVHFFGNIWWRKVNNDFLFWNFREIKTLNEFVNFRFYQLILDSNLQETFFIGLNWTNNVVFKIVINDLLGKLYNGFASEGSSFFFILVHVKFLHGVWWDVFTFVFRAILHGDLTFDTRESFLNDFFKSILDKSWDKFSFCLHCKSWVY